MRLIRADKAMDVYYWEDDVQPDVSERLTGQVVVVDEGTPNVEVVLIAQGASGYVREAILDQVWPKRHD